MPRILLFLALSCCLTLMDQAAFGHGSVTAQDDLCIIRIAFYTAHFKIYQPQTSGHREFCEDLPASGETVFVMEYLHQVLGEVPLEFRIVRNVTGLGRFTRLDDLLALTDLDAVTVFHQRPVIEKDVYTARFDFVDEGDYLGVVTARHPQNEEVYMAVFPFHVGKVEWGALPLVLLLAVLAQLGYWFANGKLQRWYRQLIPLALVLLWPAVDAKAAEALLSETGVYRIESRSEVQPLPLNSMHDWVIRLSNSDNEPLRGAEILVSGGMPGHNHGLPTAPRITALDDKGNYRIEGLRFHMPGEWFLLLEIKHMGRSDTVRIPFSL